MNYDSIDEFIYCTTDHASFACEAIQDIHSCHGRNTLLLLEGWDEWHGDQQHNLFLASIVSGKLLKDASVLITSRPSSIGTIQKSVVTRNIAILGFSEDQIQQYLQHCLEDNFKKEVFDWAQLSWGTQVTCLQSSIFGTCVQNVWRKTYEFFDWTLSQILFAEVESLQFKNKRNHQ